MAHKTILIADRDLGLLQALKLRCQKLGVGVRTASGGLEVLKLVHESTPDLLILDIDMPAADGLSVCEELTNNPTHSPLPVIFFGDRSDPETLRRFESLDAHYVLKKNADTWVKLEPLIGGMLRNQRVPVQSSVAPDPATSSRKVLVVDNDFHSVQTLKIKLQAYGLEVLTAYNAKEAFWKAVESGPGVIITDYGIANGDGKSLLIRLKIHSLLKSVPVIVITDRTKGGLKDRDRMCDMLEDGSVVPSFTKPLDFEALVEELRRHVRLDAVRPGSWDEPNDTKTPS